MSVSTSPAVAFVPTVDQAVVAHYRSLDKSTKATFLTGLKSDMKAAMGRLDPSAFDLNVTIEACTAKVASVREPVNASQFIADRVASLRLAAYLLESGQAAPTDLDVSSVDFTDLPDQTRELDEDGSDPIARAAREVASAKISRSTQRRSIQSVIDNAFADLESGDFLTVAEIRTKGQWTGYVPSDGAIAARLYPTNKANQPTDCTLEGVEPVAAVLGVHPVGARKV